MLTSRRFAIVFALAAAALAFAALFHLWRLIAPIANDGSPPWRHGLFVLVDAALALALLMRPRWFVPIFALVVVQQIVSHGSAALAAHARGTIDVVSLLVVFGLPLLLVLLIAEQRAR